MASVGQLACDCERGTDGCVRGPHDTGSQPPGERAGEPTGVQRRVNAADHGDAEGGAQKARGNRTASLVPRIEEIATNEATGSRRTPVDSGP
jgi:hypothetical protein